jgi:hypothetical protein
MPFCLKAHGGIVRAAAARRAGSDSSASRSATADSASANAETATLGDANGPDLPNLGQHQEAPYRPSAR